DRPFPLHHLRGRGLPDLRRSLLLVPEGHREAVPRAARPAQLLDRLRRDQPALLPDAHRRPARDAAAAVHLPGRPRLDVLQPRGNDRRLPYRRRDPATAREPRLQLPERCRRGVRPLARADARVGHHLASARVQLPGRPEGHERIRELGPRGRPAAARRGSVRARARARAGRGLGRRCSALGRRPDAARVAVAAAPRGVAGARVLDASSSQVRSCRGDGCALRPHARRLALAGAGRAVSDHILAGRPAAGRPAAWWAMAMLIASEATLFGSFVGTYYYLRFTTRVWPPDGLPKPALAVPLVLVACRTATSVPMRLAWRAARAGRLGATRLFLVVALFVQSGYFAFESNDFGEQIKHRFDITRN